MQAMTGGVHIIRAMLAALLVAYLAFNFWTTSRYPSLDEKAVMSGAIQLEDPLGFEAEYPLTAEMTTAERIGYSTLNWINTNRKGMTFGVLFGAAFLTLIGYFRRRSFRHPFANSLLGLVIGAPLGVCVNCAAPIAKGLYSGGMRAETTLSAMIASPTLNVVVLTMAFSLLPTYMALTKIALSLLVILIAVPLICRMLPGAQLQATPAVTATRWDLPPLPGGGPLAEVIAFAWDFARNLWFILRTTVPLMLLAGFLGAIVATLLPSELLESAGYNIAIVVLVALVGTFLPVPIAFDVVVTGALLTLGLQPGYVMALVFTLGSFSIYSWFIVQNSISLRAANLLAGVIVALGILSGIGAQVYHDWQSERALKLLLSFERVLLPNAAEAQTAALTVEARPFAPRTAAAGATPFTRLEGHEVGIDKPIEFSFRDMWPPYWEGRGLTSGDIDGDGDLDLVIGSTERGIYVYANDGTGHFTPMPLDLGAVASMPVFLVALVDLDNDGWLDLFFSTYREGNHVLPNKGGHFDVAAMYDVANRPDAILTMAASFADVDGDGTLDAALGNWASGWYRRIPGEELRNRIVFNRDGLTGTAAQDLDGMPGETLSILLADFNGDGKTDLIEGNDFEVPDYFRTGDGKGNFTAITAAEGMIPHSTTTTMAVKVADLANDGMPEIYLAQIAGRSSGVSKKLRMRDLDQYCDDIRDPADKTTCAKNMAIKAWYKSGNNFDPGYASRCAALTGRDVGECKAMMVKDLAIQRRDPGICKLIPATEPLARSFCDIHFLPPATVTQAQIDMAIPQVLRSNVLLEKTVDGPWTDRATSMGLEVGGWSWDTKIADFDLDGWQDMEIVNGTWVPNEVSPSNMFFRNRGDGHFSEETVPFGLEDYLMTAAATVFDMDGDGDPDMITQPVNGPVMVYRNDTQDGHAIAFELRDRQGNSQGIGARLEIRNATGEVQTREIQSGGGFMSFDAARILFGLGADTAIDGLTIRWPDGDETPVPGPLAAGQLYRITRN